MRVVSAFVVVAAVLLPSAATATGARAASVVYRPCPHNHPSAPSGTGFRLGVTHVRVSRISCSRAAASVRAGKFELTPGGPLFSTPGFVCRSPIGPPPPGSKPRYFRCAHRGERFEFLVPGSS